MLKINDIELEKVVALNSKIPMHSISEFVLVGRSNVGKSSFINAIANRKNYAHTSSTPGKTRTINYYLCNKKFYIVDLPGYGYAKASISEQNRWALFINKYLKTSTSIAELIMLLDIRHKPTDKDIQMYGWILQNTGYEPIIVATKADKIKKTELDRCMDIIKTTFNMSEDGIIIPFSAATKLGVDKFLGTISNLY